MEFENLAKEQLHELSTNGSVSSQLLLASHGNMLVNLLGEMGTAYIVAQDMAEGTIRAHLAEVLGLKGKEVPEHEEMNAAIDAAVASVALCYETVLDAVMICFHTMKDCKCPRCQQRRQMKVAKSN